MIEAKAHTPFYCKPLSFSVGKEKDFKKINEDNIIEVKGLCAGTIYFILDDDAYIEVISFIERKENGK